MNLYNYLNTVNRLWNNSDGYAVSKFLSLNGNHVGNTNLHLENAVVRQIEPPLDEVIYSHLKVLYYLHLSRKYIKLQFSKDPRNICLNLSRVSSNKISSTYSTRLFRSLQTSVDMCSSRCENAASLER